MNYACISDQSFVTRKDLSLRKGLSDEAKERRKFIRSHKFSVCVDPSTEQAELKITKE